MHGIRKRTLNALLDFITRDICELLWPTIFNRYCTREADIGKQQSVIASHYICPQQQATTSDDGR